MTNDVDAHTRPTTTSTERIPTMAEGSNLTSYTTTTVTVNEPTTTTESLGKDIHTTSRDQKTIGVVPDGENDKSFVIKLPIYLSASSVAISLASPILLLGVVLFRTRKRKAKVSESASIELTGMRESTTETVKPKHTSNIYMSPIHNHYSSEEKLI